MTRILERIAAGRTDLVFDWVAEGGAIDADAQGGSLVGWCGYYGDVSGLRFLLGQGASLADFGPTLGLGAAAFHGHWRLCQYDLESGADPNFADPDSGETALHAALCKRQSLAHERVVEVLLAAGADPNRPCAHGVETGCFMRDIRTKGETPLHRAAAYGTARTIRLLLDAGAALDARDAHGDSPLTWASWALRDADVLRMLCFGPHRIDPEHSSMEDHLLGKPV
jgi:ankyrin repeat protein